MIKLKYIFLVVAILSAVFYYSCDDAGFIMDPNIRGNASLSPGNLEPLELGVYELWLALDTNAVRTWYSLGRFNMNASGEMIDPTTGNAATFRFPGDTNQLNQSKVALLTFETDGDPNPSNYRIMSGSLTVTSTEISGDLKISGVDALGNVGAVILGEGGSPAIGDYILRSPTTTSADCFKGLWFCDTLGASHFTAGLDLPPTPLGWIYGGWVERNTDHTYYPTGVFSSFNSRDNDAAGPCLPPGSGYDKPGQDFVTGCSPGGIDLNNGNYGVYITIEPVGAGLTKPFFFRIFQRLQIQSSLHCGERDVYLQSLAVTDSIPKAHIVIAN